MKRKTAREWHDTIDWLTDLTSAGCITMEEARVHLAKLEAEAHVDFANFGLSNDPRITADD